MKKFIISMLLLAGFAGGYLIAYFLHQNNPLGFHRADYVTASLRAQRSNLENGRKKIKGVLINHHLLAPDFIAKAFSVIRTEESITVVLLSPNHFLRGHGNIIGSAYHWQTPYGTLEPDRDIINKLEDEKSVNINEAPFEDEHGIFNIIPFIKNALPNAKIVPIIIKDSLSSAQADSFADKLAEILPEDAIVAASLDFSHEVSSEVAEKQDLKSLDVIKSLDYEAVNEKVKVDSAPALRIFLKFLKQREATNFTLLNRSNSSMILKQNRNDTTSYITGFFNL